MADLRNVEQASARERSAHKHLHDMSQELYREIRAAHKAGASLRALASVSHLSHESIRRLVSSE